MNCTFADNILVGTGATGGAIYSLKTAGTAFNVTNCILWGNTNTNEIAGATGFLAPTVSYTDTDQTGYAGTNGNINQDPLFVDGSNSHLQIHRHFSVHQCRYGNRGTRLMIWKARRGPKGLAFDMGAFEYILGLDCYHPFIF